MHVTDEMVEAACAAYRCYWMRSPAHPAFHSEAIRSALEAALRAAPAAEPVSVKPLEWVAADEDDEDYVSAFSEIGAYSIERLSPDSWELTAELPSGGECSWYVTIDAAKAAAQADYERRIRSALAAPPAPVADGGRDRYRRAAEFAAKMAWRQDPPNAHQKLTDSERLSAIKHHPDIKALAAAPTEAGR